MKTMLAVFLAGFFLVLSPNVKAEEMPVDVSDSALNSEEEYTDEMNQEEMAQDDEMQEEDVDMQEEAPSASGEIMNQ